MFDPVVRSTFGRIDRGIHANPVPLLFGHPPRWPLSTHEVKRHHSPAPTRAVELQPLIRLAASFQKYASRQSVRNMAQPLFHNREFIELVPFWLAPARKKINDPSLQAANPSPFCQVNTPQRSMRRTEQVATTALVHQMSTLRTLHHISTL